MTEKKAEHQVTKEEFDVRKGLFLAVLIIITGLFFILTILAHQKAYFGIDLTITRAIQQFDAPWFDLLMRIISDIGYLQISAVLLLVTCGFLYSQRYRRASVILAFSVVLAAGLIGLLKILVGRDRPDPNLIHLLGPRATSQSFPSGHVMFYVSFFGFLLFLSFTTLKNQILRFSLCLFLIVLITLIGFSRIYLGEHWFSDVLGAYLLGFLWLTVSIYIYHKTFS